MQDVLDHLNLETRKTTRGRNILVDNKFIVPVYYSRSVKNYS